MIADNNKYYVDVLDYRKVGGLNNIFTGLPNSQVSACCRPFFDRYQNFFRIAKANYHVEYHVQSQSTRDSHTP